MSSPLTMSTETSMTSLQIAEVVGSRHDSVKRAIERLADRGAIVRPPVVAVAETGITPTGGRRTYSTSVYHVGKRDSYVVVAQLSPEFTARLVDRWQELEQRHALQQGQLPDFTDASAAARAWADANDQANLERERAQALLGDETKLEAARNQHDHPHDRRHP